MQKNKTVSKYHTNKRIKEKIDKLLHKNAIIQSNIGTDTTQEEKDKAMKGIKEIAYTIYDICPTFSKDNFLEIEFEEAL